MVWSVEWRRAQTQLLLCLTVGSAARTPKTGGDLMLAAQAGASGQVVEAESVRGRQSVVEELPRRARPPAFRAHAPAAADSALHGRRRSISE